MDQKVAPAYDEAAKKIKDLSDASKQENKEASFSRRLNTFKEKYARRSAMMRRITKL